MWNLQKRVGGWMIACFGSEIAKDKMERNYRFLEESLELVQALGCSDIDAHRLVDYVFNRPIGQPTQEVGGVMITLAALCNAQGMNMDDCAETELERIWDRKDEIREKHFKKPITSPLPQ